MTDGYVELRCRSAFSFLRGASLPEALVARAVELGHDTLALVDRESLAGAVRFHRAAADAGIKPIVGAEIVVEGAPLPLLCETQAGYRNLCRLLSRAGTEGPLRWDDLEERAEGLLALCGGAGGHLAAALDDGDGDGDGDGRGDPTAAAAALDRLVAIFGPGHAAIELGLHRDGAEDRRNVALVGLARRHRLPLALANDVHYATPAQADLCDVLACTRARVTVDQAGTLLLQNAERHLKAPAEMARLLPDLPEAVAGTRMLAERCAFTLKNLGYRFPDYPVSPGETQASVLRAIVEKEAPGRFRPYEAPAREQLARELALICRLELAGYFLIVWEIIQFCRQRGILVQGRGSAANSAVCFALGITAADPIRYGLLFERFLSEERDGWPDIDLDLPSGARREEVIQHVYSSYGPTGCGMTAVVSSYRARAALRDVGRALGFAPEQLRRLAARLQPFAEGDLGSFAKETGLDPGDERVRQLLRLCAEIQDLPRHLSQHPGGLVLSAGRLDEVVPLRKAAMPDRLMIQWDKDDCAAMGLIKIDLLGLGMMAALEEAQRLCPIHDGAPFDLAALPPDDAKTYEMLRRADTVGVFQVESRAQMATLPRLRPERFYDLVIEVALIRPGPIVGGMVHPYLRRRRGEEEPRCPHPSLEPILRRTLGVPLFQEQVMKLAMTAAGFTGGQAEELRRAMGFKRSEVRMAELEAALRDGMTRRGITGAAQEEVLRGITSFAQYGFPESHAISFALLAYASAYLKAHHPAVFYASLLNAWPMGFYHPSTLVQDALRLGVEVLPVDVNQSAWACAPERRGEAPGPAVGPTGALRLGLRFVRGLRREGAAAVEAARAVGPLRSVGDLRRRCPALRAEELEALAAVGALGSLEGRPSRRGALWQASALAGTPGALLAGAVAGADRSPLREMSPGELVAADYAGLSLTAGPHPMALCRGPLAEDGVLRSDELRDRAHGARVRVAGVVIVRQRPPTAKGFFFLTLEDEAGLANVIVAPDVFAAHQALLCTAPALIVEGTLQQEGLPSVKGHGFAPLRGEPCAPPSHDFH
jgi:error-prone DNA polymerase